MLGPERHRAILRLLAERGSLSLAEIGTQLNMSPATVRRDANGLTKAGLACRTHGGLLLPNFVVAEPEYLRKAGKAAGVKARIGRATADLVPEEGNVFVDAGSTCLEVGRILLERPNLRIFTNSVPLLALAGQGQATVTSVGGEVRKLSLALTGAFALGWLRQLRFDVAVIGASGLDPREGAFTTEITEAGIKAEALRRAHLTILVAHGEKWKQASVYRFAPWAAFDHFLTDRPIARGERSCLNQANTKIHVVATR